MGSPRRTVFPWSLPALAVICGAALLRVVHLLQTHSGLDADEAVVGLMAKHILEGLEAPVFYYGQHYFGALEAYLTVPIFTLLGVSSWALRLVPLLSSLLVVAAVGWLATILWNRRAGWLAAAMASVPPLFSFDFQLRARGGFPESMALTLLLAVMSIKLLEPGWASRRRVFAFGLLTGLLLFVFQAALLPVAAFLALSIALNPRPGARSYLLWFGGTLLGAAPLLLYNLVHPFATILEAGGQKFLGMRIDEYRQSGFGPSFVSALQRRLEDLLQGSDHLWTVLAGRPWSESGWPEILAGALLMALPAAVIWQGRRLLPAVQGRRFGGWAFPATAIPALLLALTLVSGFLHPRYLLLCFPLAAVLSVGLAAPLAKSHTVLPGLLLLLPILFAAQQVQQLSKADSSGHLPLVECLRREKVQRGYADYWLAYPVVFLTREEIVLSPAADPAGVDRYPAYTRLAEESEEAAFVWMEGSPAQHRFLSRLDQLGRDLPGIPCGKAIIYPALDRSLREKLLRIGNRSGSFMPSRKVAQNAKLR